MTGLACRRKTELRSQAWIDGRFLSASDGQTGYFLQPGRNLLGQLWTRRASRDSAYTDKPFAQAGHETLGATVQIAKRSELYTFAVIPKRWVVERSFAWLDKCRRLWKNGERKLNTRLQFIHPAFLVLLLRRA